MPNKDIEERCNLMLIKMGQNISCYRNLKEITQQQLAEKVGLSKEIIANIEGANQSYITMLQDIFDIADALKVSVDKLFHFEDD